MGYFLLIDYGQSLFSLLAERVAYVANFRTIFFLLNTLRTDKKRETACS